MKRSGIAGPYARNPIAEAYSRGGVEPVEHSAMLRVARFWGSPLADPSRYRAYAAQCVQLAADTTDEKQKLLLLEMAQHWLELARDAQDEPGAPDQ